MNAAPAMSATLRVWVQPGASHQRITGMRGDALKVAVSAPPEKGKANKALLKMLARELRVSPAAVSIVAGGGSRRKLVKIEGVSEEQLNAWLETDGRRRTEDR